MPHASHSSSSTLPDYVETAPIANPDDCEWMERLWLLSFGAYGNLHIYAWADSLSDAFEVAVEYLDDEGQCGVFTFLTSSDYQAAADELDLKWDPSSPDYRVMESAEADLTSIGWTTLECERSSEGSAFIPSWEWNGRAVHGAERTCVKERSLEEAEDE